MTHHPATFPHPTPAAWTDLSPDDKAAAVTALVALGKSPAEIATDLGTTRNAVISVAHRIKARFGHATSKIVLADDKPRLPLAPAVPDSTWHPHREPVTLLERRDNQCAWPVGDPEARTFCGGRVHKRGHCQHHYGVAFKPLSGVHELEEMARYRESGYAHGDTREEARQVARVLVGSAKAGGKGRGK